jgi:alpha-glucoside transport system permease protein
MALVPVARLYGDLGIFGSILGVVLFHIAFGLPFAVFLLRNFFAAIPRDLAEAARLDGASELRIFSRIMLPLGLPAIASLAIFQFLWVWNDLLVALVFAKTSTAPITVAIQQQLRAFGGNIDIISAASFISMIVPLVVFFAFQRYFTAGLLAGSVK